MHAVNRYMLSEMEQDRARNKLLREAENQMAREMMRFRVLAKSEQNSRSSVLARGQSDGVSQLQLICGSVPCPARQDCLTGQLRKRASQLRSLPTPK